MAPLVPTATNRPFPKATLRRALVVAEPRLIQLVPSAEVTTVPEWPTAMNVPFPYVDPERVFPVGSGLRHCHVSSGPAEVLRAAASKRKQRVALGHTIRRTIKANRQLSIFRHKTEAIFTTN